jgi:hypothetical protein
VYLRQSGRMVELVTGHGDHTCTVYQLTREQLIGLDLDAMKMAFQGNRLGSAEIAYRRF